jgi:hypothetical protein
LDGVLDGVSDGVLDGALDGMLDGELDEMFLPKVKMKIRNRRAKPWTISKSSFFKY